MTNSNAISSTISLLGLVLLLTGCSGVTTNSETLHPTAAAIEESGLVEWTIDANLTRDDVGMAEDRDSAIYDSLGRDERYQVRLTLPGGLVIEETVKFISAFANTDSGPPCSVSFSRSDLLAADEAEAVLAEYQGPFNLDADEVARWRDGYDTLVEDGYSNGQSSVTRLWGPPVGEVQPTVITHVNRTEGTVRINVDLDFC